jgi:uncharacterized iron-regulated protein
MMRVLLVGLTVAGASVVGASELDLLPLGPAELAFQQGSASAGTLVDTRANEPIELGDLTARLAEADVVLLGEEHTAMDQKLLQAQLVDAVAATGRRVVLAMEFFQRDDRDALDRWVAGELDDRGLLEATGWYDRGSYRWAYTRPVMEVARARGLAVVGANVPREIPRTVNRQGLEGLSEDQRAEVGEINVDGSPQHRYLVARYFGDTVAMLPPSWFDNMYAAQCLWDVVMARSILAAVAEDTTVILVVGSGHVAYGLGIPRRLADERSAAGLPPLRIVTFCPVTAPAPDPDDGPSGHPMGGGHHGEVDDPPAIFARSLADHVGVFADRGGIDAYPTLGLRLADDDEQHPKVSMPWPGSRAETVGFAAGDRVLDVNGRVPTDLSDLRFLLAELEWGDRAGLLVERDGAELEIAALLFPEIDTSETAAAPGYELAELTAFSPEAPVAAPDLVVPDDRARWRLVRRDDAPVRVEVHRGDILDEVHELGDDGRVVRSLYRVARDDGTVEIRYRRGGDGQVVDRQAFDRTGAVIDGS